MPKRIKILQQALALSQMSQARFGHEVLDVSERTLRNWLNESTLVPFTAWLVCSKIVERPEFLMEVQRGLGRWRRAQVR